MIGGVNCCDSIKLVSFSMPFAAIVSHNGYILVIFICAEKKDTLAFGRFIIIKWARGSAGSEFGAFTIFMATL
jgi:hypothetical protein